MSERREADDVRDAIGDMFTEAEARVAAANAALAQALAVADWYGEQAEAIHRYLTAKNTDATMAVVTALSLDAGYRANQLRAKHCLTRPKETRHD